MRTISSRHNPIVRVFRDAADAPDADGERVLLDGAHLVGEARASGADLEVVVVAASRFENETEEGALARALERDGLDVVVANDRVFAALSPVRTPSGIVAIARRRAASTSEICSQQNPFVLVAVDVQDPGNVGSLLRAAEAGGVTGALICGASANPFSWKALRGSMGSALRLPVVPRLDVDAAVTMIKEAQVRIVAAVPRGGKDPDAVDWRGHVALALGGEGPGLADDVVARCDERVTIPMSPSVESLNVAVSGAIIVYAARRQRTAK